MTIDIRRSYSSNNVYLKPRGENANQYDQLVDVSPCGLGWSMHFGRMRLQRAIFDDWDINYGCRPPNDFTNPDLKSSSLDNPVMEMPDGSQRQLFCNDAGAFSVNSTWTTKDNWTIDVILDSLRRVLGFSVISPQGMKYTMNRRLLGGRDRNTEYVWYATRVEDRNGNFYTISFDNRSDNESPIYSRINASDGRVITFNYRNASNINGGANNIMLICI